MTENENQGIGTISKKTFITELDRLKINLTAKNRGFFHNFILNNFESINRIPVYNHSSEIPTSPTQLLISGGQASRLFTNQDITRYLTVEDVVLTGESLTGPFTPYLRIEARKLVSLADSKKTFIDVSSALTSELGNIATKLISATEVAAFISKLNPQEAIKRYQMVKQELERILPIVLSYEELTSQKSIFNKIMTPDLTNIRNAYQVNKDELASFLHMPVDIFSDTSVFNSKLLEKKAQIDQKIETLKTKDT